MFQINFYIFISFLFLFMIQYVNLEFRFCHFGPQSINDLTIGYGIIWKKPINTSCLWYYSHDVDEHVWGDDKNSYTIYRDICLENFTNFTLSHHKPYHQTQTSIQAFFREDNINADKLSENSSCTKECLSEWIHFDNWPKGIGQGNPPKNFENNLVLKPNGHESKQNDISFLLFHHLLLEDVEGPNYWDEANSFQKNILANKFLKNNSHNESRMEKIFKQCHQIFFSICTAPYVPLTFQESILKSHLFLLRLVTEGSNKDFEKSDYLKLKEILDKCYKEKPYLILFNDPCGIENSEITHFKMKSRLNETIFKYKVGPNSWGQYDPFIESAWNIMDFVYGYCFESTPKKPDNYQAIFQRTIALLFPPEILERWAYPIKLQNDYFWNILMGTNDIKISMKNLNACTQSGYLGKSNSFSNRIGRPFQSKRNDTKPQKKGWTGTLSEYWTWYNENHVDKIYLEKFAKNFNILYEDRENYFQELKNKCPKF